LQVGASAAFEAVSASANIMAGIARAASIYSELVTELPYEFLHGRMRVSLLYRLSWTDDHTYPASFSLLALSIRHSER
jgi:hypothetical protein